MTEINTRPGKATSTAIAWMLLAVALFSVMDAAMKWLTPFFPPLQITALRGLTSVPLLAAWILFAGTWRRLRPRRYSLHLLRGVLGIFMLASFAYGLKRLSLADTYTLFFIGPLLITLFAAPLLGEQVGRARWTAILVGLVGVLVVLRPTGSGYASLGAAAVLGAAIAYAVSAVTVRVLSRTDTLEAMMFWMTAQIAVGATVLTGAHWQPVTSEHWPAIVVIGVTGTIAQYALMRAFQLGEASAIAPFEYCALAFGVLIDWWLWQTLPDRYVFIGAAIIIGSGIYLIRAERTHLEAEHP